MLASGFGYQRRRDAQARIGLPPQFTQPGDVGSRAEESRVPGHTGDFLRACKDSTAPAPCSNFAYSVGLTEIVLLGTVALRCAGQKLVYDMAKGRFTNSDRANTFLTRTPRKGWELGYEA